MRVFKVNYELANGNILTAGILSENKDKALVYLRKKVPNIRKINSISSTDSDIHAIDDEVLKKMCKGAHPSEEENKGEIEKLKEKLISLENRSKLKDVTLEEEKEKVKKLQENLVKKDTELKTLRESGIEKSFICEECGKSFTTTKGLKIHKKNKH